MMDFISVREFRASSRNIWSKLSQDGKIVITNNGKPAALLLDLCNEDLEETLLTLRQVRAIRLFNGMRADAQRRGFLSEKEIEKEIKAARVLSRCPTKRIANFMMSPNIVKHTS